MFGIILLEIVFLRKSMNFRVPNISVMPEEQKLHSELSEEEKSEIMIPYFPSIF